MDNVLGDVDKVKALGEEPADQRYAQALLDGEGEVGLVDIGVTKALDASMISPSGVSSCSKARTRKPDFSSLIQGDAIQISGSLSRSLAMRNASLVRSLKGRSRPRGIGRFSPPAPPLRSPRDSHCAAVAAWLLDTIPRKVIDEFARNSLQQDRIGVAKEIEHDAPLATRDLPSAAAERLANAS